MWSVDVNITKFGVKFIALFTVCLILFLILIPFNATLLFTRTFSRYRFVNCFKPLLDVYQAPFKIKFYYWVGLHLLTKALFYAMSVLSKTTNLTIGIIVLHAITSGTGYVRPFKCWIQNCNELILLFNLSTVYAVSLSGTSFITIDIMFLLAVCQFILIVIYHMIVYTMGETCKSIVHEFASKFKHVTKAKQFSCFKLFVQWIMRRCDITSPDNNIKLPVVSFGRNIPDKTYDYSKYQEPLLGHD